jgi:hypothetical protein
MKKRIGKRLADRLIVAYVEWRETCLLVDDAYRTWSRAPRPEEETAFTRYAAAVDAEEHAADLYASLVRRVGRLTASDPSAFAGIAA